MLQQNISETGNENDYKDVFRAFLVNHAEYEGEEEFPLFDSSKLLPKRVIPFSKALSTKDYNQWVVFFEHDYLFERIWNHPRRYLGILKRFEGVISPDFSLYRDMPLCMQKWSTYKGRALAHWWSENGIEVIPNVRFSDERSYDFCFDGIEHNSVVAIGTHGCIKCREDREFFIRGLAEMVHRLTPHTIIVYGAAPDSMFKQYKEQGIYIVSFESSFSQAHTHKVVTA